MVIFFSTPLSAWNYLSNQMRKLSDEYQLNGGKAMKSICSSVSMRSRCVGRKYRATLELINFNEYSIECLVKFNMRKTQPIKVEKNHLNSIETFIFISCHDLSILLAYRSRPFYRWLMNVCTF